MKTEENDKIQDRREFFKQAAKKTLPVLAVAPMLQSCDTALLILEGVAEAMDEMNKSQNNQPASTYKPNSSYSNNNYSGCGACASACNNSCTGTCRGTCSSGCSGGCTGTCNKSCKGDCSVVCASGCVYNCRGTCKSSCVGNCFYTSS